MSNPDCFPPELLNQPKQVRWTYFYHKIVAHSRLVAVHEALRQAIHYAPRGRLIHVFGPTGVGKTTLRQGIERALVEELRSGLIENRDRIPVASLAAIASERGNFDWHDFYQRALLSLHEPLANAKVVYEVEPDEGRTGVPPAASGLVVSQKLPNIRTLRQALEKCLRYRRPAAFVIDDAHHLQRVASGRRLRDQMDTLKSLADQSDTVLVLLGTYELLNLTNLSDQLSRRSYHICFARYRADSAPDVAAFKAVLKTFQEHLPLPEAPDLVSRWEYLYENSAGCVGLLKVWLCDTLAAALERGQKTISDRDLRQYAMPPDRLMSIVREMVEGERKVEEQIDQGSVRAMLDSQPDPVPAEKAQPPRKNRRVGERRPSRDSIQGAIHVP